MSPHCSLLEWQECIPCFREIFQAGPSRDRSTSIWLSLVALPRVIWGDGGGEGSGREVGKGAPHRVGKDEKTRTGQRKGRRRRSLGRVGTVPVCLTSRERIRYRTMRPRNTARVWLSKSGELMPERRAGSAKQERPSPVLGWGDRQGERGLAISTPKEARRGA